MLAQRFLLWLIVSLSAIASRYLYFFHKYPLQTNAATGFVVASFGDLLNQRYFETTSSTSTSGRHSEVGNNDIIIGKGEKRDGNTGGFRWNVIQSVEMGVIRAFFVTPWIHHWYPLMDKLSPGKSIQNVLGRVAIDQTCGSPITISIVFLSSSVLRLKPFPSFFINRMQTHFFSTWTTGLRFWPFIHSINFSVVPQAHRPLFAHFASVYWNAVLSYHAHLAGSQSVSTSSTRSTKTSSGSSGSRSMRFVDGSDSSSSSSDIGVVGKGIGAKRIRAAEAVMHRQSPLSPVITDPTHASSDTVVGGGGAVSSSSSANDRPSSSSSYRLKHHL